MTLPTPARMPALPWFANQNTAISPQTVSAHVSIKPPSVFSPNKEGNILVFLWAIYTLN